MRKTFFIALGAALAATTFSPVAYAKHRMHKTAKMMMAAPSPVMNANGDFYATPISPTGINAPGLALVPGLREATGVVDGIAAPLVTPLTVPATLPGLDGTLPGLDAANGIVNGITAPLLPPAS